MRKLALVALLLSGCATRYMYITAASALGCPQGELKHRERDDGHYLTGCGKTAKCSRAWAGGPDEWNCEVQ